MFLESFMRLIIITITKYADICSGETGDKFRERIKEHRTTEKHKKK